MSPEKRSLPDWAQRERQHDFEWIRENLHDFWPTARTSYDELGKGVIVVDTTSQPQGEGHPFAYFPQEAFEEGEDEDISRMLKEYNPQEEFVILLLKSESRTSTYRIKPTR